jgi:HEAT repeat protein
VIALVKLHGQVAEENRPAIRAGLTKALGRLYSDKSQPPTEQQKQAAMAVVGMLRVLAADGKPGSAAVIAEEIAWVGEPLVEVVRAALKSPGWSVQTSGAKAASEMGPVAAAIVPELIAIAQTAERESAIESAANALGHIGPAAREAVPVLMDLLDHEEPDVVLQAAFALGRIGPAARPAVTKLLPLLQHKNSNLVVAGMFGLSGIGGPATGAIPQIEKLLFHEVEQVRNGAAKALDALTKLGPAGAKELVGLYVNWIEKSSTVSIDHRIMRMGQDAVPAVLVALAQLKAVEEPDRKTRHLIFSLERLRDELALKARDEAGEE